MIKYIYLDSNKANSGHYEEPWTVWWINTDDEYPMDNVAVSGSQSVSGPVSSGILNPVDQDYWFTNVAASGFAQLPTFPVEIIPTTLSLFVRNLPSGIGMAIRDVYVIYKPTFNSVPSDIVLASGFLTQYDFPAQTEFVNTELQLTLNPNTGDYYHLLPSGIPTLEFGFYDYLGSTRKVISEINLYSSGTNWVASSGFSINNNIGLFMTGSPPSYFGALLDEEGNYLLAENNDNLFPESLDTPPLYIHSVEVSSGNCDLYIYGIDIHSGTLPLFLEANIPTSTLNLYLQGVDPTSNSGTLSLWMWGTNNSGIFNTLTLSLGSDDSPAPDYQLNLAMVGGGVLGSQTATLNLVIVGGPTPTNTIDLVLWNGYVSSNEDITLFLSAPSGTLGAVPTSGTMNLFIGRDNNGTLYGTNLYISGPMVSSGIIPMYMLGGSSGLTSDVDMYINGLGYITKQITPLFVRGL